MLSINDKINFLLKVIGTQAVALNQNGLTDASKLLENLVRDIFSILDNTSFTLYNDFKCNQEGIDLLADNGTSYQVTTREDFKRKIDNTIGKFKNIKETQFLKIIFFRNLNKDEKQLKLNYNKQYQSNNITILDLADIYRCISNSSYQEKNKLYDIIYQYYPVNFDNLPMNTFSKKREICDNFIDRSFTLHNNQDAIIIDKISNLLEIQGNYLIIGDASIGKTEILKYLNNIALEQNRAVQYCRLNNYNGKDLKEWIASNFVYFANPLLLLDGFDELEEQYIQKFIQELNNVANNYPGCQIVITSRANFCSKTQTDFPDFKYITVNELTDEDIKQCFIQEFTQSVYESKLKNCQNLHIDDLLKNPFYLIKIVDVFKKKDKIYNKVGLMEDLFDEEVEKFQKKIGKKINKNTILEQLQKLACKFVETGTHTIKYAAYTEIKLKDLKKFAWLFFDATTVSFVHNNFKEYLVALSLNQKSFAYIKKTISVRLDKICIKAKYYNILSFLLQMQKDKRLQNFIIQYGEDCIFEIDSNSLEESTKLNIITKLFAECKQTQCFPYIVQNWNNWSKLAQLCNSVAIIEFIYNQINNIVDRASQVFALKLLREIPYLYGFNEQIQTIILDWLLEEKIIDTVLLKLSIYLLKKLHCKKEKIQEIFKKYYDYNDSSVRAACFYLIKEYSLTKVFIQEILENIDKRSLKNQRVIGVTHVIDVGERIYATKALEELKDLVTIDFVLDYINKHYLIKAHDESEVEEYILKSIYNLNSVSLDIEEKLYILLKNKIISMRNQQLMELLDIIYSKNLLDIFIDRIINDIELSMNNKYTALALLYRDKAVLQYVNLIQNKKISSMDDLIGHFNFWRKDWTSLEEELKKNNIKYKKYEQALQDSNNNRQIEFNNLFCINIIQERLCGLYAKFKVDKLSFNDVIDLKVQDDDKIYLNYFESLFQGDECLGKEDIENKINIDWQIENIYNILTYNADIQLNSEQYQFIEKWVQNTLQIIDFEKAVQYTTKGWLVDKKAEYCKYFIKQFDINVDSIVYEKILCCDWGDDDIDNFSYLEFLEEKLGVDKFKKSLQYYCNQDILQNYPLTHKIRYCRLKNYDILLDCILNILSKIKPEFYFFEDRIYFDYLNQFNYLEEILKFYGNFNKDTKVYLIELFAKNGNNKILNYAEKDIEKNNSISIYIAKALLPLASVVAIHYYLEWVKRNKAFVLPEESYPPKLTAFKNIKYLPTLFKFLDLSYLYQDEDNEIRNDIIFCFKQICIGNSIQRARKILKKLHKFIRESKHENIQNLNHIINNMRMSIVTYL